ncbi:30S ribosomal protein S16 [Chlamydia abortus]|nr:30S ribosomal protein S16 [Chlamydia abortus]
MAKRMARKAAVCQKRRAYRQRRSLKRAEAKQSVVN